MISANFAINQAAAEGIIDVMAAKVRRRFVEILALGRASAADAELALARLLLP